MNRAGVPAPTSKNGRETRRLDELSGLSAEATRLLPTENELQAGQLGQIEGDAPLAAPSRTADERQTAGRRLALNTLIVGGAFVLSRMLGLVREAVIAWRFGTTKLTDDYIAAFRLPDTLFLLIIGGAVGSAFIPVFTRLMGRKQEDAAWRLTSTLINASVVLLSLSGILLAFFAPALVGSFLAANLPPADQARVVELTRIMLFSPLFMGLGGWAMGILNARQQFTLPAFAPVAYNLAIIFGALFLVPLFGGGSLGNAGNLEQGIYGLAWGVVVGSLLHFGVQVPGLVRAGMRYSLRLNLRDAGVGEVGKLLLPRIAGQAAFQANVIGATSIALAAFAAGHLAAFNNAYQLMILPHGIFAMSIATTTFPTMAAQYAESDITSLQSTLARGIRVLLFLIFPSSVGLLVLRTPIVSSLLRSGAFGSQSTLWVSSALGYFALGLTAYAVVEVLTRGFYALHDTRTPVVVAVITVAMNLLLSALLVFGLGWREDGQDALALSLAITTTVEMVLLWVYLGRKLPGWSLSGNGILPSAMKSAAASVVMGLAIMALLAVLGNFLPAPETSKPAAIVLTAVGIAVGAAVYGGVALLLRSEEVGEAVRLVRRRRGA